MCKQELIDEINAALPESPFVRNGGSLLLMVGLPGSGKSSIVENLYKLVPFVLISTDGIRAQIRRRPQYTASEMTLVYQLSYQLIERRLRSGQRVVFDASNYLAARRDHVAKLAESCGAPVAVCLVQAAQETIRERLFRRVTGNRRKGDLSDADWSVYKWMVEAQEPVMGPHLILDTTDTLPGPLAQKLYHYWINVEVDAASNPDLQPPSWASKLSSND
ncbi:MAG: ATP-binding protein [Ardenticatenaceae bacterium]|nr:ATP-binding protein [Anaerolineales bacterium]MCB8992225.1 ATP-binding protein [Ardenticatenaceae bacterium]